MKGKAVSKRRKTIAVKLLVFVAIVILIGAICWALQVPITLSAFGEEPGTIEVPFPLVVVFLFGIVVIISFSIKGVKA